MYAVIYRDGGTERPRWNKIQRLFKDYRKAVEQSASIELMGYKAIIYKADQLEAIGPPVGWDASHPDPAYGTRYWGF